MDKLNRMLEKCEHAEGFLIMHSVAGGTGSGLTAVLTEQLARVHPKLARWNISVYPSAATASSMLETYNTVLSLPFLLNFSDLVTPLDC